MFKENDITVSLFFNSTGTAGVYNHLYPAINPSFVADDLLSIMVSLHERAHADLNTKSPYGMYLTLLTYLQQKTIRKTTGPFLPKQALLVKQCRVTHEVYATYSSIQSYLSMSGDEGVINPLEELPEYLHYYNLGEQMAGHVPGAFVRQTFLFAVCTYCFLSSAVTKQLMAGIEKFELRNCRAFELADQRFYALIERIKEVDVVEHAKMFSTILKNEAERNFLLQDMMGTLQLDEVNINTHLLVLDSLHAYLVDIFKRHFDQYCGESLSITDFENMRQVIVDTVAKEFPFEMEGENLLQLKPNGSLERHLLLQYENEKIQVWSKKPACIVVLPAETGPEFKTGLYQQEGEDYHLMIEVMLTSDLLEQYAFVHDDDRRYLATCDNILLVLKQPIVTENNELLVYVMPFENPEEVNSFFCDRPDYYPFFGNITLTALAVCINRNNEWKSFIKQFCWNCYTINDISLAFMVEEDLVNRQGVTYLAITTDVLDTNYSAIVFMLQKDIGEFDFMLIPGSVMYISYALNYLQKNYPAFTFIEEVDDFHKENGDRILKHIFTEQYMVGFKSSLPSFE